MLVTLNPLKKPVEWSRNGVFVVDDADWTSLELAVLPNLIVILSSLVLYFTGQKILVAHPKLRRASKNKQNKMLGLRT